LFTAQQPRSRPTSAKRARRDLVEGIAEKERESSSESTPASGLSTPHSGLRTPPPEVFPQTTGNQESSFSPRMRSAAEVLCSLTNPGTVHNNEQRPVKNDKWVQVKPQQISKAVQHVPYHRSRFIQCNLSSGVGTKDVASSSIKQRAAEATLQRQVRFAPTESFGSVSPNPSRHLSPSASPKSTASKSPAS